MTDDGPLGGAAADVLVGTTGVLLLVLVALGPGFGRAGDPASVAIDPVALRDAPGPVLLARADGLLIDGAAPVPPGAVRDEPRLDALGASDAVTLLVAEGGGEAAFHARLRLAATGARIALARLPAGCRTVTGLGRTARCDGP